ncbi:SMP-30/gluconolactonase/LRE family protein [Novosphingobium sp.]|uniref:SMP-30/gluconolactonase/LRE family protein n=1 Tax=Novosphingobium sp. TaxID=1874826 RepID=UPI001EC7A72C|nr:SMP-30/gluconolactonase/LRE family protein [Novosphingobium sp.]MBK9010180.1 SMP-30/gluconolactonase/LRE family protein [Novosphingobium sp.]
MQVEISFLGEHRARLGESPLWDDARACLWWVDAIAQRIRAADLDGKLLAEFTADQPVGSIGLADGGLIVALADGFYLLNATNGRMECLARVPGDRTGRRLNDGKVDPAGRFVCGDFASDCPEGGTVWQIHSAGRIRAIEQGVKIANAICFAPDGAAMYLADSLEGVLRRYPYDPATGDLGARADLVDCNTLGSAPDGATNDTAGNVWTTLVMAQALACFSPGGELLHRIALPVPYPSCPAFGGKARDILFATSISDSGHRIRVDHPDGGRIMVIRGLRATGLPEPRFGINNHE